MGREKKVDESTWEYSNSMMGSAVPGTPPGSRIKDTWNSKTSLLRVISEDTNEIPMKC